MKREGLRGTIINTKHRTVLRSGWLPDYHRFQSKRGTTRLLLDSQCALRSYFHSHHMVQPCGWAGGDRSCWAMLLCGQSQSAYCSRDLG